MGAVFYGCIFLKLVLDAADRVFIPVLFDAS